MFHLFGWVAKIQTKVTWGARQHNMRPSDLSFEANCWIEGLRNVLFSALAAVNKVCGAVAAEGRYEWTMCATFYLI